MKTAQPNKKIYKKNPMKATVQSTLPIKVESVGTEEIASTYRKFDL